MSARTGPVPATNLKPSIMFCTGDPWSARRGRKAVIINRPAITARKLTPLAKKHQPSPISATTRPASAGPITRAPLNMEEFRAMALTRSSRGNHVHDKGLARRNIKGIDHAHERAQQDYMPDLDDMRERESGKDEGQHHHQGLSDHQD